MESSRTCEICNVDVHRASYTKYLRSKNHLEKVIQDGMNIPEWLFKEEQTPIEKKIKKYITPKL